MSERRSVIAPPEITNGSRSGSVSSNSSARAIRVIVIDAEPRQNPETKRNHHEQPADGEESLAPTRWDQPCHGSDGDAEHDHQEVCALDLVALLQPPYTVGEEHDHPEASQQDHHGPANPRLGGIDGAAPHQDSGEHEKRQASQATTFVHPFSPGTRSRKCSSPLRRARVPAASRSSMTASNPSRGSNTNAWSARWVREPSVAGYSSSGSWKKVCSWTEEQPRSAYSTIRRPEWMLPVPDRRR